MPLHLVTLPPARGGYAALNPHVVTFNRELAKLAAETGSRLIDLHRELADERGELPAALTGDGLHWNDAGYERVGKLLQRSLAARGAVDRLEER